MLDRFTSRARRVVVLAIEEARNRGHESVRPEHLLMGILRDSDGMAVKVLERLQAPAETLRAEVERLLSQAPHSSTGAEPTFSPELKAVLQASVEAQRHPNLIGTEILMLGLLTCEGSEANRLLRATGVDLPRALRMTSLFYDSVPATEGITHLFATSRFRMEM
jgi:ATP-dependent Clp protease ATP-binding subunit ClpC